MNDSGVTHYGRVAEIRWPLFAPDISMEAVQSAIGVDEHEHCVDELDED